MKRRETLHLSPADGQIGSNDHSRLAAGGAAILEQLLGDSLSVPETAAVWQPPRHHPY